MKLSMGKKLYFIIFIINNFNILLIQILFNLIQDFLYEI